MRDDDDGSGVSIENAHDIIWLRWGVGVVAAVAATIYGFVCIVTHRGVLVGRGGPLPIKGVEAVTLGIICIAIALALHCQFYWESYYADHPRVTLCKAIGVCVAAAGVVFLLVRMVWF